MDILVTIDDTDNLLSRGTGHLAEILRKDIEKIFKGTTSRITRHQLFVCDEIPYTSHNSAMCFEASINKPDIQDLIKYCANFLESESAEGSDPGLCVAAVNELKKKDTLIQFGKDATKKVLTKDQAYTLAGKLGIHLSEHGGTGGGVIGALAGTGLRLYGNNGRFRGWLEFADNERNTTIKKLLEREEIDQIATESGLIPALNDPVILQDKVKTVFLNNQSVLLVRQVYASSEILWENLEKEEIKKY
ncbi:MAG: hypothetical protein WDA74_03265 [Spirochaetota bacterium]